MAVPVQKNTFRFRFTAGSIHNRFRFRAGSGSHGPVHSVPVPVRSLTDIYIYIYIYVCRLKHSGVMLVQASHQAAQHIRRRIPQRRH